MVNRYCVEFPWSRSIHVFRTRAPAERFARESGIETRDIYILAAHDLPISQSDGWAVVDHEEKL